MKQECKNCGHRAEHNPKFWCEGEDANGAVCYRLTVHGHIMHGDYHVNDEDIEVDEVCGIGGCRCSRPIPINKR